MGKNETIRENVADVRVHAADMHVSAGRWASGTYISGTTTWTGTAAFTVVTSFLSGSAAAGAGSLVYMGTTAAATALCCMTTTAAFDVCSFGTQCALQSYVATASNCGMAHISAGGSVVISATGTAGGKYFFQYITTPT